MEKSERGIRQRAFQLREKGFTYALIEKKLGIPYAEAKLLGHEYDIQHGKPRKIVRRQPNETSASGSIKIPVRDLRNDVAGILRQVEAGRRFVITVAGREVAELGPLGSRPTFAARLGLGTTAPLQCFHSTINSAMTCARLSASGSIRFERVTRHVGVCRRRSRARGREPARRIGDLGHYTGGTASRRAPRQRGAHESAAPSYGYEGRE